jgi:hypothetical protein
LGATEALLEAIDACLEILDRSMYDRTVAAVRTTLGENRYATMWAEGRALPLEQAITDALAS